MDLGAETRARRYDLEKQITMMKIPVSEPSIGEEELKNIIDCVKSSWISSKGKYIEEFEDGFSKFCGAKFGVSTSNGTAALHLALVALGVGPGDEVIVPTLTFVSTASIVTYCGAKPVFIDSEPSTWNIDSEKIKEKITDKTKALIPVHLYGYPADMDPILEIARDHGIKVVEDAAESHGAEYKGKKVGSFGDISCFSFYGNKILTTGEGGMCLTNNKGLAGKLKILKNHGMDPQKKYWHTVVGFNYRMTNMQAAIGVAQLQKMDKFIKRKLEIAGLYNSMLKDVDDITIPPNSEWARNVYWMYTVLVEDGFGISKEELMKALESKGIETRPVFHPITDMPPYKSEEKFPVAKEISRKGVSLPSSVNLKDDEIKFIVDCIKQCKR
jgi:perosamine synthetase